MTERQWLAHERWLYIYHKMTGEGFDYCWRSYSDFEEMKGKDFEEFHRLRKQYIEAADALENLVKSKIGD